MAAAAGAQEPSRTQARVRSFLAAVLVAVLTIGLLEAGLRTFPQLLPVSLIADFPVVQRGRLAQRLDLPSTATRVPVGRSDGGPALTAWAPHAVFRIEADPEDVVLGATTTYQMDDQGFCNADDAATFPPGSIVVLGDSFTWCTGVRATETWASHMQRTLGRPVRNLGLAGVGPYEYLQLYEQFGAALRPAIVVLNVYQGNDLRDAAAYHNEVRPGTIPSLSQRTAIRFNAVSGARIARSALVRLRESPIGVLYSVDIVIAAMLQAVNATVRTDFGYTVAVAGEPVAMNIHDFDADEVDHARVVGDDPSVLETAFAGALESFQALSLRDGFTPVVAYTPSAYTAYADSVRFSDAAVGRAVSEFSAAQRRWFAERCATLGIAFADLTMPLRAAARTAPSPLYFPANIHLTAAGHAVVAGALVQSLAEGTR